MNDAIPSPKMADWQREHLDRYLATNGADGHMWQRFGIPKPIPTLILTTKGRSTGQRYMFPLIYGRDGEGYVLIASKGGAPKHPGWYRNLEANPEAEIQVVDRKYKVRARTVPAGAHRDALWKQMAELFPPYDDYQAKAGREIPLVVLDPAK